MAASEKYAAQKTWEGSGANDSADKPLSEKNHNRTYRPEQEAERKTISQALNSDAAKYKAPSSGM